MTPRRILLGGWLLFLLACYPGFLKHDGVSMLIDSRYGQFTDAHSPMMTQVWRIVGIVISGPAGMLALQSLLFLLASYALLARVTDQRTAAIAAIGLLLVPPIFGTMALICPEAQLASFLLAAAVAFTHERRWLRFVGLGLMVIACGMRDGASAAALPIMVMTFRWRDEIGGWRRYALATAVWLVVAVLATALNWLMVDDDYDRNEVALALSDIVGTFASADEMSDAELKRQLGDVSLPGTDGIQARARAAYGKPLEYTAGTGRVFEAPDTMDQRAALLAARRAVIQAMPGAYLRHRAHQFARLLGLSGKWSPVYTQFVATTQQIVSLMHAARSSVVQSTLQAPLRWLGRTFLFRPYIYFALTLVLLPLAVVRKQRVAAMLLASGFLYELSLFFLTIRQELRDSHWMIATTLLGCVLVGIDLKARHKRVRHEAALGVA